MPRAARPSQSAQKSPRPLAPAQVPAALRRFAAPAGTDRYAAGKSLIATADTYPIRIYPYFDALAALLTSESNIIRWNAMRILAALAAVDDLRKIDPLLDTFFAFITGPNMISAANAIHASAQIARARPDLLIRVIHAIMKVESATYQTTECRNIAIGHALDALKSLGPALYDYNATYNACNKRSENDTNAAVQNFIRRQLSNSRPATARRARQLLP